MSKVLEEKLAVVNNNKKSIVEGKMSLTEGLLRDASEKVSDETIASNDSIKSVLSKTMFQYNIPEIENFELEFVYNYFTKDEREVNSQNLSNRTINLNVENTSNVLFQATNDLLPRFVRFNFKPPRDPNTLIASRVEEFLAQNIDKIVKEGGASNKFFTGIELKDTGEEKAIYNNLKTTGFITQLTDPEDSSKNVAQKISDLLEDPNGLTGQGKKYILESLNQLKDDQLTFAASDVRPEVAAFSNNPVGRQTFSVKFNNLFINDIVQKANRIPTGVFQDEIYAFSRISSEYQQNTLSKIGTDPTKIYEDEFINHVEAFEILSGGSTMSEAVAAMVRNKGYEIKLLGYLIEKTEIFPDESVRIYPPFLVNDPQKLFVRDDNVRYGGNYAYTVRTICQVTTPVVKINKDDPILDEVVLARFIMTSEGVTDSVLCIEKVPPPPPTAIRPRFEFKLKKPIINWQFPVNPQRDIKRFQIFKRENINLPFTLIAEYDFDDSTSKTAVNEIALEKNLIPMQFPKTSFLDEKFGITTTPIYAVASVDAHGMTSNLSTQIQIRYDKIKNKMTSKLISREGAPKQYPNIYLEEDTFKDVMSVSSYKRMHVFFDPEYYRVLKNDNSGTNGNTTVEKDLKFIAADPDNRTYSIQILNVDLQKDGIVNIKIEDKSAVPQRVSAGTIVDNN
jgi:hypothetical protein